MRNYKLFPYLVALALGVALGIGTLALAQEGEEMPFEGWTFVDLTHTVSPDMPIWPGDPEYELEPWATIEEDGYNLNRISIGEHSGTHFGAPIHFIEGGRTAETFTPRELVRYAVVFDVSAQGAENPDYRLTLDDVLAWEEEYGPVPTGSVALLYTGWAAYWDDPAAYMGEDEDGVLHWPGFSAEAADYLVNERGVAGLGIDTHGVDPGNDEEFAPNTILFEAGGFHLENLTNLDQLPPTGAILFIGAVPYEGGTGGPARVFALIPPQE